MSWRRVLLYAGLAAWLFGVVGTLALVWRYKLSPGANAAAPAQWPVGSALRASSDRANLVMIAHPHCPCTDASMTELQRLAGELGDRASIHVVVVRPHGAEPGFEAGDILNRARTIAGAEVVVDVDGREADRFGAVVSGSTLLYAADGTLLFRGGLTTARGHEGRGPAHDRIVALIDQRGGGRAEAPTFGCALEDE